MSLRPYHEDLASAAPWAYLPLLFRDEQEVRRRLQRALPDRAALLHLGAELLPVWTFDCQAAAAYRGTRQVVREGLTLATGTDGRGQLMESAQEVEVPVSGQVSQRFQDVLVSATTQVPSEVLRALSWDLSQLEDVQGLPPREGRVRRIAGDRSLEDAWREAQDLMRRELREMALADVGDDEANIGTPEPCLGPPQLRHVLLPVWVAHYRGPDDVSRCALVQGQSGQVSLPVGEARPDRSLGMVLLCAAVAVLAVCALLCSG